MEQSQGLLVLVAAATLGIVATLAILRRQRKEAEAASATHDSPFAASTEGEKRCPHCGMGNLWTDARCVSCGRPLPG